MTNWVKKLMSSATSSRWDLPRATTSVALLVAFAADRGVLANRVLRGTGISAASLQDASAQITAGQELLAAGNLVRALDAPPALGLEVGMAYDLPVYGILGFALLSSEIGRAHV